LRADVSGEGEASGDRRAHHRGGGHWRRRSPGRLTHWRLFELYLWLQFKAHLTIVIISSRRIGELFLARLLLKHDKHSGSAARA